MILADKIIALRKKNGWSQEELAEKMNVTRQSVSKWEGAQSVPDLDRILQMSRIFGVSTDYLLKDDIQEEQYTENKEETALLHRVSMEEANEFLEVKNKTAPKIAFATFLCIISPIGLILMGVMAETGYLAMTEDMAGGLGMILLLLLIATAVAVFIFSGSRTKQYQYLETEEFETEYGVTGMVNERQKAFKDKYTLYNVIGTCLCILSSIPLFVAAFITEDEVAAAVAVSILLVLVAIGVQFFIRAGIPQASMQKLLQEGDYSRVNKRRQKKIGWLATVYWLVVVAIFLGYSFSTDGWDRSWIIWPVAGVLFGAVYAVAAAFVKE